MGHNDYEIDLRMYLNIFRKRRNLILAVFSISVLSTLVSCFFSPMVYSAKTILLTSSSFAENMIGNNKRSAFPLPVHRMLLTTDAVLKNVISKMGLKNKQGENLHIDQLASHMKIQELADKHVFELTVVWEDPTTAVRLVNIWAEEYIAFSKGLISGDIKGTSDFLVDQFKVAEKNLYIAQKAVVDFKNSYKIDLMQAELNIKKEKLNAYKTQYLSLQQELKDQEDLLKGLNSQIAVQKEFISTSKAITDDALWVALAQGTQRAEDFGKKKLTSQILNPIYENLKSRTIDTEIQLHIDRAKIGSLMDSIASTENGINNLERTVDEKELEFSQLTRNVDTYQGIYKNLSAAIQETRLANVAELGECKLVSPAFESGNPVSRHILRRVFVAGFCGLVLGFLLAFFMEIWIKIKVS